MKDTAAIGNTEQPNDPRFVPPAISMPKGGGAIKGIGEKFTTNAVTGSGTLTIPLPLSPGRAGFTPALALNYDSASGNGPYGFGWSVPYPAVTRRTDRGLPRYLDAQESDVFLLSGAEDLVPFLNDDGSPRIDERDGFRVVHYRPRIEGLFARIERWTKGDDSAETFWRSISRANVTTRYGISAASRIFDPDNPARIFAWLVSDTFDDRGNAAIYEYAGEDGRGVNLTAAHESNRSASSRTANRYLKRVKYGNTVSRPQPAFDSTNWLFELVMDYGDHEGDVPTPEPTRDWLVRPDPFSSSRGGFEVRTYRRCQRVLMFHRFEELGPEPRLVRALTLEYDDLDDTSSPDVDAELVHAGSTGLGSFLQRAESTGYSDAGVRKSLPPLELASSRPQISDEIRALDDNSAEHLPIGVDGSKYRWLDFKSEGLAGVLTEQGGAWWYKPNLGGGRLGAQELVAEKPAAGIATGVQFVDLAGDGLLDAVQLNGPVAGFFERTAEDRWAPFTPFVNHPNIAWDDPNLRFIDLTGDSRPDLLITEDDVIAWHASLAEEGYSPRESIRMATDEARGPKLVFSDTTDTIFLADMSGDGMSDLVRVRNGEICYWPNLGYGRFGAKVTMDDAPLLDAPDLFDARRIRMNDIDGSGVTDIVYLASGGVRLYLNRSGNSWTPARGLRNFPPIDNIVDVTVTDLLGNGTACIVWSSALPRDAASRLFFVDLMGGNKPHLLTGIANNLGVEMTIDYTSSTHFYVKDREAGRPWITRLPFPVHVVESVETRDRISRNRFVTRHAYHHGYFDGVEREFRGFGMVEQFDTEEFAAMEASQELDPATNFDASSHVPPVLTRTWFHTGAQIDRTHVSDFFAGLIDENDTGEYFREPGATDEEARALLLDDTLVPAGLSAEEEREACRALKGAMLHREVYALDGTDRERLPYSVTEQNFEIRLIQPQRQNPHAVFLMHPRESIGYHYERSPADARVFHAATLRVDAFGNVLESATVAYGRRLPDPALAPRDQLRQSELHVVCAENGVTNAIDEPDAHRTPLPCETRKFELTGLQLTGGMRRFSVDDLRAAVAAAALIDFDGEPTPGTLQKRPIEHARTLYRRDDLAGPLAVGVAQSLALPFESYAIAFSSELMTRVYGDRVDDDMLSVEGGYIHMDGDTNWWAPSGRVFYSPDVDDDSAAELAYARQHFFLPCRYRNALHRTDFNTESVTRFDRYDLLLLETRDALGNVITAGERDADGLVIAMANDYRVLRPRLLTDENRNRNEVAFDALGVVVGTAAMGKRSPAAVEGDSLEGFEADLPESVVVEHLANPLADPHAVLARATSRIIYDTDAYFRSRHLAQPQPVVGYALARETHAADLGSGEQTRVQHVFAYSDGFGREIQRKTQAEPGRVPARDGEGAVVISADGVPVLTAQDADPRWVASGWTIFNNKAAPVRQYEPFFTDRTAFEFDVRIGVSPVIFYDPLGRVVGRLRPDHTWEKIVFDAWRQETWDVNDTILVGDPAADPDVGDFFRRLTDDDYRPTWFALRDGGSLGPHEQAAARKAAIHAATPTAAHADALGRAFLSVAHNRFAFSDAAPADPPSEERYETRLVLDIEGRRREVIDANDRVIVRCDYSVNGAHVHVRSMDAGERRMLANVLGMPIYAWNSRNHRFRMSYDVLARPTDTFLSEGNGSESLVGRSRYGEGPGAEAANQRGKGVQLFDQAGVVTSSRFDFKGNLLAGQRQFTREFKGLVDWSNASALAGETFSSTLTYDALNRPIAVAAPDQNVYRATFNAANLLERIDVTLRGAAQATPIVDDIDYDAKAQRAGVHFSNGAITEYARDRRTQRLVALRTTRAADGAVLQELHYTYDPVGNVTHIADAAQQTIYFANQAVGADGDYTYDAIYRLINADGREHVGQLSQPESSWDDRFRVRLAHPGDGPQMRRYRERFEYDPVGNFLRLVHNAASGNWTREFAYAEASAIEPGRIGDRLSSTTIGNHAESYAYDAHGNTTSMPHLSVAEWDAWDQLRATAQQVVTSGTPETTYYLYDGGGARARKVTARPDGSRKNERIYLAGFELYREYDAGGDAVTLERETLHVTDDRQRVALVEMRTQGTDASPARLIRFQLGNHLGSVSLELDEAAQIISYEEYSAYGSTSYQAVRNQTDAPKRYRFSAMERDEESGFSYHNARYYVPWLCRWLSTDPAGLTAYNNLYLFCHANPLKFIDVDGRDPVSVGEPGDLPATASLEEITAYANAKGYDYSDPNNQRKYETTAEGGRWVGGTLTKRVYDPAADHGTGFGNSSSNKSYADDTGSIKTGGYSTNPSSGADYDPFAPKKPKNPGNGNGKDEPSKGGSPGGKATGSNKNPGITAATGTGKDAGTPTDSGSGGGTGTGDGSGQGQDGWLPEIIGTILTVVLVVLACFTIVSAISAFATYFSFSAAGFLAASQAAAIEVTPFLAGMAGISVIGPRQPQLPPGSRVVSPLYVYDGYEMMVVETSVGRQTFYRSSGANSGMPDQWLPFDEFTGGWMNKGMYGSQSGFPSGTPLHRFGSDEFKEISNALTGANIPRGQGFQLQSEEHANQIFDFFGARLTPWSQNRPVPDPTEYVPWVNPKPGQ